MALLTKNTPGNHVNGAPNPIPIAFQNNPANVISKTPYFLIKRLIGQYYFLSPRFFVLTISVGDIPLYVTVHTLISAIVGLKEELKSIFLLRF